jgi:hypothetical protein
MHSKVLNRRIRSPSQKHETIYFISKQLESTTFRKLDLFPSTEKEEGTSTLLDATERANLNRWALILFNIPMILKFYSVMLKFNITNAVYSSGYYN